jgi:hypothetical protein
MAWQQWVLLVWMLIEVAAIGNNANIKAVVG